MDQSHSPLRTTAHVLPLPLTSAFSPKLDNALPGRFIARLRILVRISLAANVSKWSSALSPPPLLVANGSLRALADWAALGPAAAPAREGCCQA